MDFALEQTFRALEADGGKQPYWLTPTISPTTVAYMVVLGVAAALVTALLPGLKLTAISERRQSRGLSSSLSARLNQTASKPAAFRFGGIWNALIIGQIALAVPLTPLVFGMQRELDLLRHPRFGFAAEELVGGSLKLGFDGIDATAPASLEDTSRLYEMRLEQLRQRMLQDPRVVGVGYTERMPGTRTAAWRRQPVQVEGLETTVTPYGTGRWWTSAARVSPDYFSVLGARMLAGREFTSADLSTGDAVIVTEAFVAGALRGGNAIGRRIRVRLERNSAGEDSFGPWLEIVGVVADHGGLAGDIVYEPMTQVSDPVNVIVHAREGRDQVLALLQSTVADVDPTLRLEDPILMEDVNSDNERIGAYLRLVFTTSFGVAVLLAIGGLYAVMSFTVTDRTREIGIRRALGASRTRTLGAVLRRPILQALSGVTVGAGLFFLMQRGDVGDELGLAMSVMLGICLLATLVPARQALRVEPTHALRAEG